MADITETGTSWPTGVRRLERTDAADAGANQDGPLNLPLVALANRTAFIKAAIETIITGEGAAVDNADPAQLYAILLDAIANATASVPHAPVGEIMLCAANTPLPGTLLLDGSLVTDGRANYPDLWAYAQASGNITDEATWAANQWGSFSTGDLATNFRLIDMRGEFPRGADNGRGVDIGRLLGVWQADEFESHVHTVVATVTGAAHPASSGTYNCIQTSGQATLPTGGIETRPRNIPFNFCIKY